MSDFRCIQCKSQFGGNSRIGDPDLYCNHASPSHFQDKQFMAEDRVRELEKENERLKELADHTNCEYHMKLQRQEIEYFIVNNQRLSEALKLISVLGSKADISDAVDIAILALTQSNPPKAEK